LAAWQKNRKVGTVCEVIRNIEWPVLAQSDVEAYVVGRPTKKIENGKKSAVPSLMHSAAKARIGAGFSDATLEV